YSVFSFQAQEKAASPAGTLQNSFQFSVFSFQPQEKVASEPRLVQGGAGEGNAGELSITGLDAYHLLDLQPF
ncbi:MAG TPA: hypothetical protein VGY77_06210, partial [Gemmataceae bacterium]|nr:hypothetical protein [Gemmataceae bacterium]